MTAARLAYSESSLDYQVINPLLSAGPGRESVLPETSQARGMRAITMGAGKPRSLRTRAAVVIAGLAAAAAVAGCDSAASAASPDETPAAASAPGLGLLRIGSFPSTWDGSQAQRLCDQWAGLRGQYAGQVRRDTPFELEQWFSTRTWLPAFNANSPLKTDPKFLYISSAFGLVSTAAAASLDNARLLDAACAAAD